MTSVVHIDAVKLSSGRDTGRDTDRDTDDDDVGIDEETTVHVKATLLTRNADDTQRAATLKKLAKVGQLGFEPLPFPEHTTSPEEMRPQGYKPLDGKRSALIVPTGKEDLTPAFCTAAFRARGLLADTESVTAVSLTQLGAGEGEASDNFLMALQVDGVAPKLARSLVAKFTSAKMSSIEKAYNFSPEAHFYNDMVIEACGLIRPNAPYVGYVAAQFGGGTSRYCIIQEFCAAPAVLFKRYEGLGSVAHMRLVMRALARFHARWWNHPQEGVLKCYVHPEHLGGPFVRAPRVLTQTAQLLAWKFGLKALTHCFSDEPQYAGVPKFATEYADFVATIRPLARRRRRGILKELAAKKPLSLVHGDAHLENIFFGPNYPGGVAFIDFGLVSFAPPMVDVATIIGGGMPTDARRTHEEALVREYYSALTTEFGGSDAEAKFKTFPWEACWQGYTFQLIRPFFNLLLLASKFKKDRDTREGVFAEKLSESDVKKRRWYAAQNERLATALADHKWAEMLAEMPTTSASCCRPCD